MHSPFVKPACRSTKSIAPAVLLAWLLALPAGAGEAPARYKLLTGPEGIYRVTFGSLARAGLRAVPSSKLALTTEGEPVPIWIEDGGDGSFDPGDVFDFVGRPLRGATSHLHEFTSGGVYFLTVDGGDARRVVELPAASDRTEVALETRQHLEKDVLLLRLQGRGEALLEDEWYWAKMSYLLEEGFVHELDLSDARMDPGDRIHLEIDLRGLTTPIEKSDWDAPDHAVDLLVNGVALRSTTWNGSAPFRFVLDEPLAPTFRKGPNRLQLKVPARKLGKDVDAFVDVSAVNFVEAAYPRDPEVNRPVRLHRRGSGGTAARLAAGAPGSTGVAVGYGDDGTRVLGVPDASGQWLPWPEKATSLFVSPDGSRLAPGSISAVAPPIVPRQADYLMIAHPSLEESVGPLAEFHRSRGLAVTVATVDQLYDQYTHGVVHPRAIRDFVAEAYTRWPRPAPRFVLLVGDASWDSKNEKVDDSNYALWVDSDEELAQGRAFRRNQAEPYGDVETPGARNLVPSSTYLGTQGHSANDNWFVCVDGDDALPDLAIGRLPVVRPEDVDAIARKIIAYVQSTTPGDWRRRVLWIADGMPKFELRSERLALALSHRGFADQRSFARKDAPVTEDHRSGLRQAFDDGHLIVHFVGHGGRFIWRTAPADLVKERDLFTLDDVEALRPTTRLPIVLSMTCYSAPFDHPTADSIGEKMLRTAERGAVAFIGATWRNGAPENLSAAFLDELTKPGTIGEGFMRAKRRLPEMRGALEMYTLLGDPATPIGLPQLPLQLTAVSGATGHRVQATVERPGFRGEAMVEWLDGSECVIHQETVPVASPQFELAYDGPAVALRVLVTSDTLDLQGVSGMTLPDPAQTRRD